MKRYQTKRILLKLVVVALVQFHALSPARACMMIPKDYRGRISQNRHQAILFHQGNQQELVLRVNYKIKGDRMPEQFAWIITTPSEPSSYQLAPEQTFASVEGWARRLLQPARKNRPSSRVGAMVDSAPKLVFGEPAKVGPYDIQPVRASGIEALESLNQWLTDNKFPTEDPEHMKYFVENGFTFLCVRITPPEGSEGVASNGELAPLHLSFESKNIYYPLMFSSRQGVFDVQLFVFSDKPVDYRQSAQSLKKLNWRNSGLRKNVVVQSDAFPKPLQEVYAKTKLNQPADGWHLNMLECMRVNRGNSLATWSEDVFLVSSAKARTAASVPSTSTLAIICAFMVVGLIGIRSTVVLRRRAGVH